MSLRTGRSLIMDRGTKPAVLTSEGVISYTELIRGINAWRRRLEAALGPLPTLPERPANDAERLAPRVLVTGENQPVWFRAFYAVLGTGRVAVPVDTQASPADIAYQISDCLPQAVIACRSRAAAVQEALSLLAPDSVRPVLLVMEDEDGPPDADTPEGFDYVPDPEKVALLIYTSGTTGSPKGVMLSYRNIQTNMEAISQPKDQIYRDVDRIMMLLPIHHIYPLLGTLMVPLYIGATIVICPAMHGEAIIATLKTHKVTVLLGVPRLFTMIAAGIEGRIAASSLASALYRFAKRLGSPGFSRLVFGSVHRKFGGAMHLMVSGGAALDPAIAAVFQTLGFDLVEGYGMTESAPMLAFTRPGQLRPGWVGLALDSVELEVREGELVARGPNVMKGYFNRPAETAAILRDGWLHTGDIAEIDEAGWVRITGRSKEIIVLSNGKNVNPAELEAQLHAAHPEFSELAVYQDQDRLWALGVIDPARQPAEPHAWLREQVQKPWNLAHPSYHALAGVTLSEAELPRTRLGKLRRFQLPALARELQAKGGASTLAAPAAAKPAKARGGQALSHEAVALLTYLEREKGRPVGLGDHFVADLGMDSLDSVGLQAFVENSWGISISQERLASMGTVAELVAHVGEGRGSVVAEVMDWARILAQGIKSRLPRSWPGAFLWSGVMRFWMKSWFRVKARGLSNIPDEPCIIAPNHQSFFDAFLITAVLRLSLLKKTFFYAKSEHFKGGLIQRLARRNNIIILDINHNLKESILHVAEVLKTKRNLIIFPEGTRTRDGSLGEFKRMFAILARELNVPVVPVSIQGAWEALPRGRFIPRPFRSIRIEFLPAIRAGELNYDELAKQVRDAIRAQQA